MKEKNRKRKKRLDFNYEIQNLGESLEKRVSFDITQQSSTFNKK